jgi:hypothetical protein
MVLNWPFTITQSAQYSSAEARFSRLKQPGKDRRRYSLPFEVGVSGGPGNHSD